MADAPYEAGKEISAKPLVILLIRVSDCLSATTAQEGF